MPLVRVDIIKGKSPEYKKTLLNCIHESLVETLGIEDWDRFQRIVEIDKEDFETAPGKTDGFMIIEITMFEGRSKEQKKAVIECVTSRLAEKLGITDRAVSKWETGKSLPDASIMMELCELLGTNVNELLTGERIAMDDYMKKAEESLLEMQAKAEKADKNLLRMELVMHS